MAKKRDAKRITAFKLENEVWQYALFVRVGGTREQALRWFERKLCGAPETEKSGPYATTFYRNDERSHLIWFEEVPGGGTAAHEALHSVKHVLAHVGLGPLSDDTEEAYAYLLQWTVSEIGRRLW